LQSNIANLVIRLLKLLDKVGIDALKAMLVDPGLTSEVEKKRLKKLIKFKEGHATVRPSLLWTRMRVWHLATLHTYAHT
jgi:hypothetical protein